MSTKEMLTNQYQDKLFEDHIYKNEKKIKEDYKKRILQLKHYFQDIREVSTVRGLTNSELAHNASAFTWFLPSSTQVRSQRIKHFRSRSQELSNDAASLCT